MTLQAERYEDDNVILQTVATGLAACDESAYPLIHTLLTILLTLPVNTTSAERSFYTLRRPKTLMRSRMGEERLGKVSSIVNKVWIKGYALSSHAAKPVATV